MQSVNANQYKPPLLSTVSLHITATSINFHEASESHKNNHTKKQKQKQQQKMSNREYWGKKMMSVRWIQFHSKNLSERNFEFDTF